MSSGISETGCSWTVQGSAPEDVQGNLGLVIHLQWPRLGVDREIPIVDVGNDMRAARQIGRYCQPLDEVMVPLKSSDLEVKYEGGRRLNLIREIAAKGIADGYRGRDTTRRCQLLAPSKRHYRQAFATCRR